MGLSGSWIGFQNIAKEHLLRELGLKESDEAGHFAELASPFSLGQLPNGWSILYVQDLEWAVPERVMELSRLGMTVGCQFDDRSDMFSSCSAGKGGARLWSVVHRGGEADYQIAGKPPAEFDDIRRQCIQEQEDDGGIDSRIDFLFDAPLILAQSICGVRYDEGEYPPFHGLVPIEGGWMASQPLTVLKKKRRSWFLTGLVLVLIALAVLIAVTR